MKYEVVLEYKIELSATHTYIFDPPRPSSGPLTRERFQQMYWSMTEEDRRAFIATLAASMVQPVRCGGWDYSGRPGKGPLLG